tara:strand:+ start:5437 stop:12552 length:7116 start_codon:yes stop_codon:yes gene_type:complete
MADNETQAPPSNPVAGQGTAVATPKDTIKGWNDRRRANNQIISSMVPFVQLIGIFDEKEYTRMFKMIADDKVEVTFDDGSRKSASYNQTFGVDRTLSFANVEKQLKDRFINLYMISSADHGLNISPTNGIMMAEKVTQLQDPAGGIGLTDLQVEYGGGSDLPTRQFNARMTVNDPKILDERFEYSKLATMGSKFLLIYGWSNPEIIPGFDAAMGPPKLEIDPQQPKVDGKDRYRMLVPTRNLGNGGYWSAANVNISKYDFSFNEMGKLEINITLRDDASMAMASTIMSNVAKEFNLFLKSGALEHTLTDSSGTQFSYKSALDDRQHVLMRQYNEQDGQGWPKDDADDYITSNWDRLLAGAGDVVSIEGNLTSVEEAAPEGDQRSYPTEDAVRAMIEEARNPQEGYPSQTALYTFKQIYATVLDLDPKDPDEDEDGEETDDADEAAADEEAIATTSAPTKSIVSYEKKAAYYFLGAIMDSVSLIMADSQLGIGSSRVPSFFYRDISPDSKLNTAFQSKVKSANKNTSMDDRIQDAVIRLKERFLPPTPRTHTLAGQHNMQYLQALKRAGLLGGPPGGAKPSGSGRGVASTVSLWPPWIDEHGVEYQGEPPIVFSRPHEVGGPDKHRSIVSGALVEYEGEQTENKTRVIRALFPPPPTLSRMVGVPMRGHFTLIQTNDASYADILSKNGLQPVGALWCFIPDWKQEINFDPEGNELISTGSPDGFDPLNPTEYRAAEQSQDPDLQTSAAAASDDVVEAGLATIRARDEAAGEDADIIEESSTFERTTVRPTGLGGYPVVPERSQEPYGRGGRFFMIMDVRKDGYPGKRRWKVILTYDVWRLSNKETWNLLQKKWHNLYREYLGDYFERLMRLRVLETQAMGIPLESIYDEVLDLDWMTGTIYDNNYWEGGGDPSKWLKTWAQIGNAYAKDFDLGAEETKLNEKITMYEEIIAEQTAIIEGKGETVGIDPENWQYATGAASVVDYHGLRGAVRRLVDKINKIKIEIEQITGGHYERNAEGNLDTVDVMGNTIMLRFRNFNKVVPSETEFTNSGVQYEYAQEISADLEAKGGQALAARQANPVMISYTVGVYKPEIEYEYTSKTPAIKEEWILWNEYQVPTNNFQNRYNMETNTWEESDRTNKAYRWKQENPYVYQTGVLPKVEDDQKVVDNKLNTISQYQDELSELYGEYQQSQTAINNATTKITDMRRIFEGYSEFFNDAGKLELSPYDDTSDFDGDGIYVPCGRDQPMHLTTKVAQQWARRFSGAAVKGVIDVRNYGPPRAGKEYTLPTNKYKFVFSKGRRKFAVMGTPIRVLDPEFFQRKIEEGNLENDEPVKIQNLIAPMLNDLSYGVNQTIAAADVLSKNVPYENIQIGRSTEKSYQNWSVFGSPGIPNDFGNNQWGFSYGPPYERDLGAGNIELVGGNYVRTYKDFLNLFGKGYNPEWPGPLRIVDRWPMPKDNPDGSGDADATRLIEDESANIPIYTLIDQVGNILVPNGEGWYHPSGWYLDFAGDPVFLYPSRSTACKINNTSEYKNGVRPGGVIQRGGLRGAGHNRSRSDGIGYHDRQMTADEVAGHDTNAHWHNGFTSRLDGDGQFSGRDKEFWQAIADELASTGKAWWKAQGALLSGDIVGWAKGIGKLYLKAAMYSLGAQAAVWGIGLQTSLGPLGKYAAGKYGQKAFAMYMSSLRGNALKKLNPDGLPEDYLGQRPAWGARIGINEHCPNLTLDMKRSMIINRQTTEDLTSYLGRDMAAGGPGSATGGRALGPINNTIGWNAITKIGNYYVLKTDHSKYAEYDAYETVEGKVRPAPGATVTGPLATGTEANYPYSNPEYPYGTGFYEPRPAPSGADNGWSHGPYVYPQKSKNWVDWGDLLQQLPGFGFFTNVDNGNYTSCMVQPNGSITDGREINEGFVKFLIQDVFAPLPKNRRCACRNNHKKIKIMSAGTSNYHDSKRLNDVTYGDLFGPLLDKSEDDEPAEAALAPATFGNINNFKIDNIKNIPIRAELVDNLVNKNNTNMNVLQFLGEVLRPSAIGVDNAGNTQIATRQGEDGTFEVFAPSAINTNKMWDDFSYLLQETIGEEDELKKRFPEDILMLDFRASDSLIESVNMTSTYDPLTVRAVRDSSSNFTGSTDALLNFMSYKDIAPDLMDYLSINAPSLQSKPGEDGPKAIIIDEVTGAVTLNKKLLLDESASPSTVKNGVQSVISSFLRKNPQKLKSLQILQQVRATGQVDDDGKITQSNYATQMLANFMKKTTITFHGTTNVAPFQKVIVKGIMPGLQGLYWITTTRESITPQGFQTIIEGTLLDAPSANARVNADGKNMVPAEQSQPDVAQASADDVSGESGASVDVVLGDISDGEGNQRDSAPRDNTRPTM